MVLRAYLNFFNETLRLAYTHDLQFIYSFAGLISLTHNGIHVHSKSWKAARDRVE